MERFSLIKGCTHGRESGSCGAFNVAGIVDMKVGFSSYNAAVELDLRASVMAAARRPEVRAAVLEVYVAVQQQIDARRPLCVISGKCCRFEEYGHRLFVTTVELAAFLSDLQKPLPPNWDGAGCPFQINKLCSVHTIRPFGCRMFFCDATATEWQNVMYERFHARLKALHESLVVPYYYIEWRQGLRAILAATTDDNRDNL